MSTPTYDIYVPFLTGQLTIDISIKVISNLIHARPSARQYSIGRHQLGTEKGDSTDGI